MSEDEEPKATSAGYGYNGVSKVTPFEQAVEHIVKWRKSVEGDPIVQREREKLQRDLDAIREKKRRRRLRNPYDFS